MDAITAVPLPKNEPVYSYAPGTKERADLQAALDCAYNCAPIELTGTFGAQRRPGSGHELKVTMPSEHAHILGTVHQATAADTTAAVNAALAAAPDWANTPYDDRAAIFLRAAELITGPYRAKINAATMLGQAKTPQQAEIDSACELADFLRFNSAYARQIYADQPENSATVWNRLDYRPLDGFVYAITPFNFTAIAGNLPAAPALMGNVVIWKPALTQQFAASVVADIFIEAGLPAGVINMLPGHGAEVSEVALAHEALAGIHFTGSTRVFQNIWGEIGANIHRYRSYPRLVGETGGKDFVVAHSSADPKALVTALVRGSFEYSGQKCSASSRSYIPKSVWGVIKDDLIAATEGLAVGDVRDFKNFTSALIDNRAYAKLSAAIEKAKSEPDTQIIAGGTYDDSVGWYVRPTLVTSTNLANDIFTTEFFGPLLGVYVYEDSQYEDIIRHIDSTSRYALTGSIIANDRSAIKTAEIGLRNAAGNFYINDKSTGAVVGQQPFGGGRASGTNDKAGSVWNLIRWVSPRSIKEALLPPKTVDYPHMA
ncbi:MAG: L-glutamate gamma-semialdehyde dehydrogenase [Propionibacteriaceae bacterium]|jgi:1-pyrroline-5-carboxylate dehydrogenase|nr:L-glutamate gamma-semialdehyde dehydrogenase [Propionibacteriaceae bacterium]